jgi:hypothetical protein
MKGLSAVTYALAICGGFACGGRSARPAVAMPADAAQAFPCSQSGHPHAVVDAKIIQPGVYDMVVVATSGREAGSRAVGTLTLATATPADVSPRTGERADDGSHPIFMWGSLVMNFVGIGAAGLIENQGTAARPASADPVFPCVVIGHAIPGMDADG